jgi:hypothetical protein
MIAGFVEENRQEISRLEAADRETLQKVQVYDIRMKNFEASVMERIRQEME